jgi:hypothetical protein
VKGYSTYVNPQGFTIRELKEVLDGWANKSPLGEECEVWIGDNENHTSRPVIEVGALNYHKNHYAEWADIILS